MMSSVKTRNIFLAAVALFALVSAPAMAQTTLAAGDIAIIGMNADGIDDFAFVALVDLAAGTEITFTDSGWFAGGSFRGNEGAIKYTASALVPAGTVIVGDPSLPSGEWTNANDANVGNNGFNLATSGDQILAFQGSSASPTFVAAVNNEGAGVWQADSTSSNDSALPTGLTDGTNAVAVNEADNVEYTGGRNGDQATLLALINNNANWAGDNTTPYTFDTTAFVLSGGTQANLTGAYVIQDQIVATFDGDPGAVVAGDFTANVGGPAINGISGSGTERTLTLDAAIAGDATTDSLTVAATAGTNAGTVEFVAYPPISAIQAGTFAQETNITVRGTVTGIQTATQEGSGQEYSIADAPGANNGMFIEDTTNTPAINDQVEVAGVYRERFNVTELYTVAAFANGGAGTPIAATTVSPADFQFDNTLDTNPAEQYEGVLINFNVDLTNAASGGFGETDFDEGVHLDGLFYDARGEGDIVDGFDYSLVQGIGYFSFNEYKVLPRSADDLTSNPPSTPGIPVNNIFDARQQSIGDTVTILGEVIVTGGTNNQNTRNQVYIQDDSGADGQTAILIDDSSFVLGEDYAIGDTLINVTGQLGEFGGVLQLVPTTNSQSRTGTGVEVTPLTITGADTDFELFESELIELQGISVSETGTMFSGNNIDIDAPATIITVMRIEDGSGVRDLPIPTGTFDVVGHAASFFSTLQIFPRRASEMSTYDVRPVPVAGLWQARLERDGTSVTLVNPVIVSSGTNELTPQAGGSAPAGRNQAFVQDGSGPGSGNSQTAIALDDDGSDTIGLTLAIGDEVTTLTGVLGTFNGFRQLDPVPGFAGIATVGNTVTPLVIDPSDPGFDIANYQLGRIQSELVTVLNADIAETGNWAGNTNYSFTAPTEIAGPLPSIRVEEGATSLIGTPIPNNPFDITGVVGTFFSGQLFPRGLADVVEQAPLDDPNLFIASTNVGFGNVQVGNSRTREVVLENDGATSDLQVTSLVLNDATGKFTLDVDPTPVTLNPGTTTSLQLTFAPGTDTGAFAASLTVNSTDATSTAITLNLTGTGFEPTPVAIDFTNPIVEVAIPYSQIVATKSFDWSAVADLPSDNFTVHLAIDPTTSDTTVLLSYDPPSGLVSPGQSLMAIQPYTAPTPGTEIITEDVVFAASADSGGATVDMDEVNMVALDNGDIYILDTDTTDEIVRVQRNGTATLFGSPVTIDGFNTGLVYDGTNFYYADIDTDAFYQTPAAAFSESTFMTTAEITVGPLSGNTGWSGSPGLAGPPAGGDSFYWFDEAAFENGIDAVIKLDIATKTPSVFASSAQLNGVTGGSNAGFEAIAVTEEGIVVLLSDGFFDDTPGVYTVLPDGSVYHVSYATIESRTGQTFEEEFGAITATSSPDAVEIFFHNAVTEDILSVRYVVPVNSANNWSLYQ